jgi:glycosyltransferase involved in cell wall biosynthesis
MVFADYHHWHKLKLIRCCPDPSFLERPATPIPATKRLVWVGRLCEEKGALLLLDAAKTLADRGVDFELVLVGDGPLRGEIERLMTRHGLQKRVRLAGWASSGQIIDEVLASRALVSSSFAEGLPVVIMEALALHRPVIATSIAGVPELVQPGENGWLVPAGSVEGLADAMRQAVDMPVERLEAMGRAGAMKVRSQHNITTEAAKLEALFADSVQRTRATAHAAPAPDSSSPAPQLQEHR